MFCTVPSPPSFLVVCGIVIYPPEVNHKIKGSVPFIVATTRTLDRCWAWQPKSQAEKVLQVSSLLLVAHGQNGDGLTIVAIPRHITAVAKVDYQFPVLGRHMLNKSTCLWLKAEYLYRLPDRFGSSFDCERIFWPQEFPQPLQVADCAGRVDYSWHTGAGNSFSEPQLASHASTSSAVACSPVS